MSKFVLKSRELGYNIFVADKDRAMGNIVTESINKAKVMIAPHDLLQLERWIATTGYELEVEYLN